MSRDIFLPPPDAVEFLAHPAPLAGCHFVWIAFSRRSARPSCSHSDGFMTRSVVDAIRLLKLASRADGSSDLGPQNRSHQFESLEERSAFRREISKTAGSLSVCGSPGPQRVSCPMLASRFLRRSGSEESIHEKSRFVPRHSASAFTLCPSG